MIVHKSVKGASGPIEYRLAMSRVDYSTLCALVESAVDDLREAQPERVDAIQLYALLQTIAWELNHPKEVP